MNSNLKNMSKVIFGTLFLAVAFISGLSAPDGASALVSSHAEDNFSVLARSASIPGNADLAAMSEASPGLLLARGGGRGRGRGRGHDDSGRGSINSGPGSVNSGSGRHGGFDDGFDDRRFDDHGLRGRGFDDGVFDHHGFDDHGHHRF